MGSPQGSLQELTQPTLSRVDRERAPLAFGPSEVQLMYLKDLESVALCTMQYVPNRFHYAATFAAGTRQDLGTKRPEDNGL